MIVKKVAKMSKAGGGSFGGLADYLMDVKNDNEKVREFQFSNCNGGDDYDLNIKEIAATQRINTTAKNDKTLHLIVSFQEDENPTPETMKAIEAELVKSIGFENHQRLSVVHDNTNNLHIHIAINRIDPETGGCTKEMLRDVQVLQKKAVELEEKHHLKRDNHTTKDKEPVKIKDKEIHSGVTSFLSWIKEDVGTEIKEILKDETKSLEDLQKTLNKYNLELRERGAGIVISDKDRSLFVKASDVDRGLSKGNLTKRFGEFKPSRIEEPAATKFGAKKSSLWDEYQSQTKDKRTTKKELLEKLSSESARDFQDLKDDFSRRRELIKNDPKLNTRVKREAYRILKEKRAKEIKALKTKISGERSTIYGDNKFQTFAEFLADRAAEGNAEAIKTLQRKGINPATGDVIETEREEGNHRILPGQKPHVTKGGIVFYNIEGGKIIDTGRALKLSGEKNETNMKELLDLAKIKFGTSPVVIRGGEQFKAAAGLKMNIKEGRGEPSKTDTLDQIKQRIGDKHNADRGRLTATNDAGRWESYLASARAYLDSATKQLENAIGNLRDIGRAGGDAIRERIIDVRFGKDRSVGTEREANASTLTRAATDRERNGALQSAHGKASQADRVKKGGIER